MQIFSVNQSRFCIIIPFWHNWLRAGSHYSPCLVQLMLVPWGIGMSMAGVVGANKFLFQISLYLSWCSHHVCRIPSCSSCCLHGLGIGKSIKCKSTACSRKKSINQLTKSCHINTKRWDLCIHWQEAQIAAACLLRTYSVLPFTMHHDDWMNSYIVRLTHANSTTGHHELTKSCHINAKRRDSCIHCKRHK